jgi:hypothetical protein
MTWGGWCRRAINDPDGPACEATTVSKTEQRRRTGCDLLTAERREASRPTLPEIAPAPFSQVAGAVLFGRSAAGRAAIDTVLLESRCQMADAQELAEPTKSPISKVELERLLLDAVRRELKTTTR